MFIDGLAEPLYMCWLNIPNVLVKYTKPTTLQYSIERARDLQHALPKEKETFQQNPSFPSKGKDEKAPLSKECQYKKPLDDDV